MDAVNDQKRDQLVPPVDSVCVWCYHVPPSREEECKEPDVPCPSMAAISMMKGLAMVLSNLFQDGDNYRLVYCR